MTNTHLNLENVMKLAQQISSKYGITLDEAMQMAEFNLRYSASYAEAVNRV